MGGTLSTRTARYAIVPAAGSGSRFGVALPKQYQLIADKTVLAHAVSALAQHPLIAMVYVILAPGDTHYARCNLQDREDRVVPLYCGGASRAATVFNALVALRDQIDDADWVLVHDAARPCLNAAELDRLFDTIGDDAVGGLLALPLADTLKRAGDAGRVVATEPRAGLWRALTPQMFRYRLLLEALHASNVAVATDEAMAVEQFGLQPLLVAGAATNIKVTYPEDLELARAILAMQEREECA